MPSPGRKNPRPRRALAQKAMPQAAPKVATRRAPAARDTSIATYRERRDFAATPEPAPRRSNGRKQAPIFVVQKHHARRLHWDFRLEHGGVLWSWAVPKGPSLDPADKRLAVHVEDHPLDYADFAGTIPAGQYGAGKVETWDRGTWEPVGDPEAGLRRGELKFVLKGKRLNGHFVLVRLKPRPGERAENWLLIKEHDQAERRGADVAALESSIPAPKPRRAARKPAEASPAPGARRAAMAKEQAPQLASAADQPPKGKGWLSELKFDGYRMLAFIDAGKARLVTRNGLDWTAKMPAVARALARLGVKCALLDGEVVALRGDGVSSFPELQSALTDGHDDRLFFYAFDLLHLNGWDLRPCTLRDRKAVLAKLSDWRGSIRYSDHVDTDPGQFRHQACDKGLEGIICKQAEAPYRPGRNRSWLKLKCQDREEFVVLGWTWPEGMRTGLGSLHLGFRDPAGGLHYVGGVGTGFSDKVLADLRSRLDAIPAEPPPNLQYAGEPPERGINWVKPELVVEVRYAGWSGFGRLRHASFLGLREDKPAAEVVRPIPNPEAPRTTLDRRLSGGGVVASPTRIVQAPPPRRPTPQPARPRALALASAIIARSPKHVTDVLEGAHLTHPDRELWPGITKRDLAAYWVAVADHALPEIAQRPLALVRCPEGIGGEHFFQKHGRPGMPAAIRAASAGGAPYLAIDNDAGLVACAQIAAIELHPWGATESDPLHPDRLIFDLDPGEGVAFAEVCRSALEVRDRLKALGLASFCRTTGGKGLHVIVPLDPKADWDTARAWCRRFAEAMEADAPDRYVASVPKKKRVGRILVDWLRNGLGATAVASLCPRARSGAAVAMPVAWREVTPRLDPARFTIANVPAMLARRTSDPWSGIFDVEQVLPDMPGSTEERP
jgi:bifunctional non-homologous end joining protein LigD